MLYTPGGRREAISPSKPLCSLPSPHSVLLLGTPHPGVDSGAEGGEGSTAASDGSGAAVAGEDAAGKTAGGDAVGEVVAGAEPFDAALDTAEHEPHHAEVLRRAPRPRPHVLEPDRQLSS